MDISKKKRSANIANTHSQNTKPEIAIRSLLHGRESRSREDYKEITSNTDVYFTSG